MTESQKLTRRMIEKFTELSPLMEEHLADMDGELLPYLLMADVARWAQDAAVRKDHTAARLVDWLEHEFVGADDPEKDLIGLGFVENIPYSPEGDPLLALLGPSLRAVAIELGLVGPAGSS
jgi:hypothetical protein